VDLHRQAARTLAGLVPGPRCVITELARPLLEGVGVAGFGSALVARPTCGRSPTPPTWAFPEFRPRLSLRSGRLPRDPPRVRRRCQGSAPALVAHSTTDTGPVGAPKMLPGLIPAFVARSTTSAAARARCSGRCRVQPRPWLRDAAVRSQSERERPALPARPVPSLRDPVPTRGPGVHRHGVAGVRPWPSLRAHHDRLADDEGRRRAFAGVWRCPR
jgi:hypothetical protein